MALELAAPLWLTGLALIPALYWLHRHQGSEHTVIVSALFLWPGNESGGGTFENRQRPPRIWLLRALIAALICLALARPMWVDTRPPALTVWLDESVSLRTVENGRTRRAAALDALGAALAERGGNHVTVRSLAAPARTLPLEATTTDAPGVIDAWSAPFRGEPRAPLAALAERDREHWLVTDGASPGIDPWLVHWPFSRVLTAGAEAANAGIVRLSLRRSALDSGVYSGFVQLRNAGAQPVLRDVRLSGDDRLVGTWNVTVAAGGGHRIDFELDNTLPRQLTARMTPGDALGSDDALHLDTSALSPVAYETAGACPAIVLAALGAHPGLTHVQARGAFSVQCPAANTRTSGPRLILTGLENADTVVGPLVWTDASVGSTAPVDLRALPVDRAGRVLASVSGRPVVVQTETEPPVLHAGLDFSPSGDGPASAELLARLIERLLDRPLLDVVASVTAEAPVSIEPRPLARQAHSGLLSITAPATTGTISMAGWLALAACLLLLVDLRLVWRAGARHRRGARAS